SDSSIDALAYDLIATQGLKLLIDQWAHLAQQSLHIFCLRGFPFSRRNRPGLELNVRLGELLVCPHERARLITSKAEHRRQQTRKRVEAMVKHRLRRATLNPVCSKRVETVLQDVVIKRRKRHGYILGDVAIGAVELVSLIRIGDALDEL